MLYLYIYWTKCCGANKLIVLSRTLCGVRILFVVDLRMLCVEIIFVSNSPVTQRQCRLTLFTQMGNLRC